MHAVTSSVLPPSYVRTKVCISATSVKFPLRKCGLRRVRLSRVSFLSLDPLPTFIQCAQVDRRRDINGPWHIKFKIALMAFDWFADSVLTILLWHVRTSKDRCRSRQATIVLIVQCPWTGPRSSRVSAPMLRDTASFQVYWHHRGQFKTGLIPSFLIVPTRWKRFWASPFKGALQIYSRLDLTWLYQTMTFGDIKSHLSYFTVIVSKSTSRPILHNYVM